MIFLHFSLVNGATKLKTMSDYMMGDDRQMPLSRLLLLLLTVTIFLTCGVTVAFAKEATTSDVSAGHVNLMAPNQATMATTTDSQVKSLNGKWEFYWKQLLTPEDFMLDELGKQSLPQPGLISVPVSWQGQVIGEHVNGGSPLPQFGYGTYHLQIHIPKSEIRKNKSIYFRYVDSASKFWINGQVVGELGHVSMSRDAETPHLQMMQFNFVPMTTTIDLIVQVSNFSFREGGIVGEVKYGDTQLLTKEVFTYQIMADMLSIGFFLVLALYHLTFFFILKYERTYLWFGLLCLSVAIWTLVMNEYVFMTITDIPWSISIRLEYAMEVIIIAMHSLFIYEMYPKDTSKKIFFVTVIIAIFDIVYVSVTPTYVFTSYFAIYWTTNLIIIAYYIIVVGIIAIVRKRKGAILHVSSALISVIGVVNDVLNSAGIIHTSLISSYFILFYFLMQAFTVAYRHSQMILKNRLLTNELTKVNSELEQKVVERTNELYVKNEQLTILNRQRSVLMANIAHDLGSPLFGMHTHMQILEQDAQEGTTNKKIFQQFLASFQYLNRLVDDLFELSRLELRQNDIRYERVSCHDLWQTIRNMLQEKITLGEVIPPSLDWQVQKVFVADCNVHIDRTGICRIVRNYIDNAIKFSNNRPCKIDVYYGIEEDTEDQTQRWLVFKVTDFGIGIEPEQLPRVFERFYKGKSQRKGSGLGLAIVKEIAIQHGGSVDVQSELGVGSTFSLRIPII